MYERVARAMGELFAQRSIRLIYGGGGIGLMGAIANAAMNVYPEVGIKMIEAAHIADPQNVEWTRWLAKNYGDAIRWTFWDGKSSGFHRRRGGLPAFSTDVAT